MNKKLTKKAKIFFVCVLCIVFVLVMGALNTYEREGVVIESNWQEATIEDTCGHLWKVEVAGYKVGDEVIMNMHDRGTTSIYDDKVLKVEKVGE